MAICSIFLPSCKDAATLSARTACCENPSIVRPIYNLGRNTGTRTSTNKTCSDGFGRCKSRPVRRIQKQEEIENNNTEFRTQVAAEIAANEERLERSGRCVDRSAMARSATEALMMVRVAERAEKARR